MSVDAYQQGFMDKVAQLRGARVMNFTENFPELYHAMLQDVPEYKNWTKFTQLKELMKTHPNTSGFYAGNQQLRDVLAKPGKIPKGGRDASRIAQIVRTLRKMARKEGVPTAWMGKLNRMF